MTLEWKKNMADVETKKTKLGTIGLALAALAAAVSGYSLSHHIAVKMQGVTDYACNINATFSCDSVANSPYSELLGVPVALLGLGYFLGLGALLLISHFKRENERDGLQAYSVLVVVGLAVSAVYGSISWFQLGALCLSCIGIYAVTVLQAINLWILREAIPTPMSLKGTTNGATVAGLFVIILVVGYNFMRPVSHKAPPLDLAGPQGTGAAIDSYFTPGSQDIKIYRTEYSGFGKDYRKGSDEAKVKIVEFADFQCPACGSASQTLEELAAEFGDQLQVVFRNYPLDKSCNSGIRNVIHPYACLTAKMARCAGEIGKFWEYHDLAFAEQRRISAENAKLWAAQVGLSDSQIARCEKSKDILSKIQDDIAKGNQYGVDATPTIFINGRKFVGRRNKTVLKVIINRLLGEA